MKAKASLLGLTLAAATSAASMAQTFSENVIGVVTKTIPPGRFVLISNPLIATDNSINALFRPVPPGTSVFHFDARGFFAAATFDDLDNAFIPAAVASRQVLPGEGVFVRNPSAAPITITFIGEVPQGDLKNPLPRGLSIRSSQVPQAGTPAELGIPAEAGDAIFHWNIDTQSFNTSTFDDLDNAWLPPLRKLEVGDAFFLSKRQAGSWDRKFTVNQ